MDKHTAVFQLGKHGYKAVDLKMVRRAGQPALPECMDNHGICQPPQPEANRFQRSFLGRQHRLLFKQPGLLRSEQLG